MNIKEQEFDKQLLKLFNKTKENCNEEFKCDKLLNTSVLSFAFIK